MDHPPSIWHLITPYVAVGSLYLLLAYFAFKQGKERTQTIIQLLITAGAVGGEWWFIHRQMGPDADGSSAFYVPISIALVGITLAAIWTPMISETLLAPLTNMLDGDGDPPELKPQYSIVIAKRKRGQTALAVAEARRQLAQFPDDFEGVMLLASILAEDMKDLPGAEITLNRFCEGREMAPRQYFAVFTQLADWHLKLFADVEGARVALEKIVDRFPGTEVALQAQQRLAHLVATGEMILAQNDRQAIALPEGVENVGLLDSTEFLKPKEIEPGHLAAAYLKQLELHPHDAEVREKLATIYAKHFRRLDLATMELEQLIGEPNHSAKQIADWLNQLAGFQVELGADVATVCQTLQRIVDKYPNSPTAQMAQRRLARVNQEIKSREATSSVQLGEYEQKSGLKYGRPGSNPSWTRPEH